MFISKRELEEIRQTIRNLKDEVAVLRKESRAAKQAIEALKKTNKEQAIRNQKYDESLGKKYLSETFAPKDEKEAKSIMDEWLNGAKKEGDK